MLVSWEWLSDYVKLDAALEHVVDQWALSGLNHESTQWVEGLDRTGNFASKISIYRYRSQIRIAVHQRPSARRTFGKNGR